MQKLILTAIATIGAAFDTLASPQLATADGPSDSMTFGDALTAHASETKGPGRDENKLAQMGFETGEITDGIDDITAHRGSDGYLNEEDDGIYGAMNQAMIGTDGYGKRVRC